jgi:hypothetical protein
MAKALLRRRGRVDPLSQLVKYYKIIIIKIKYFISVIGIDSTIMKTSHENENIKNEECKSKLEKMSYLINGKVLDSFIIFAKNVE